MFLKLDHLFRPAPAIGLDLGRDCVRMLQVEAESGDKPRVIAAGRRELRVNRRNALSGGGIDQALSDATGDAVSDLLSRGGFRGRRVVAAVPRTMIQFKTVRVGTTNPSELPKLLARDAQSALGIDITAGGHLVHFLPGDPLRRGGDNQQEGLLAVINKEEVDEFTARLHSWGAEVAGLDLEPLSLFRTIQRFARRRRDAQDSHVMVDIASRSTQVIIGRANRISFFKHIAIGTDSIHATVARKLDLTLEDAIRVCQRLDAETDVTRHASGDDLVKRTIFSARRALLEDLARELSLCLRYFCVTFRCRRPERVLVCGTAAGQRQLIDILAASLPVSVEPCLALHDLRHSPSSLEITRRNAQEWSTALGLALHDAPGELAGFGGLSRSRQAYADVKGQEAPAQHDHVDPADAGAEVEVARG